MAAIPIPLPMFQFLDNNANPLAGGLVESYAAGTSTLKALFTDSTGLTAHPNPVVLDSAGRAQLWGVGSYKLILKTSAGVTLWTVDNISGGGDTAIAVGQTQVTISSSAGVAVLTAAALVPAGARVRGVFLENLAAFGASQGLTGLNVGGMGVEDGWGANVALTLGIKTTMANFRRGDLPIATVAQDITLTAIGGLFDGVGSARITATYETGVAP